MIRSGAATTTKVVVLTLSCYLSDVPAAVALGWSQEARVEAHDGAVGDHFGNAVSISGGIALVGAPGDNDNGTDSGSAYVFEHSELGWTQTGKLVPDDGQLEESFGHSVSISGHWAVVGTWLDDDEHVDSGWAYIFQRNETGWTQVDKLSPNDGGGGKHGYFGKSVSISGHTAIVGASHDDHLGRDSGSAYVFEERDGHWVETAKLVPNDGDSADNFGGSVAVSGDIAIIGADNDEGNGLGSGSAYVFQRTEADWMQVAELSPRDAHSGHKFGMAVAIQGTRAIIGTERDGDNGVNAGAAYMFEETEWGWQQVVKLLARDGDIDDRFGESVAISGSRVAIGAYLDEDDGNSSGSAYIFAESDKGWLEVAKLHPQDPGELTVFGASVAIAGGTAFVGAPGQGPPPSSGAGYVFVVPEPSGVALLLAGGTVVPLFILFRRRWRVQAARSRASTSPRYSPSPSSLKFVWRFPAGSGSPRSDAKRTR